jgi:hypothetical protein
VIGAAHAGWKGALGGVLESVVAAMRVEGASGIRAAVGPAIQVESYEVGPDFRDRFLAADADNARFFTGDDRAGDGARPHFDLPGYVAARLGRLGVAVRAIGGDTYSRPDAYFSYRRACHRGEEDYGRNLSAIVRWPADSGGA